MLWVSVLDTDLFLDHSLFRGAYLQMSLPRQEKISRLRPERDKRLSLGVGVLLDLALRSKGLQEKTVTLTYGPKGKPLLPEDTGLHFNLSHSGHYAVCALSDSQAVGMDIEKVGRTGDALILRVCAPGESARLLLLPAQEQTEAFCRLWTAKESYMKLLGVGLALDPRLLELDFLSPLSLRREGVREDVLFREWELEEYRLALCVRREEDAALSTLSPEEVRGAYL